MWYVMCGGVVCMDAECDVWWSSVLHDMCLLLTYSNNVVYYNKDYYGDIYHTNTYHFSAYNHLSVK